MKNVAKCDTWCELQNPVNHRVFERKLRPRPLGRGHVCLGVTRLSATDISALASMKNVAKCDTWCELQNPVNHRVFERKLRPRPLGRGHVCLGVTHRRPHSPRLTRAGADTGLPRAPARGWPKIESSATVATTSGG
ncbi:hypothetical protein POPTR_014G186380v4 [Populus trichocarpa]|uniref:Uncharacterized protein n=13 Tax=Populus trichocarpa TaxID=3694 RepID=A0ACC0S0W4_POPTR|nr:hypothetical protein POPTR_014G186380v4 [Populus trichocarpa]